MDIRVTQSDASNPVGGPSSKKASAYEEVPEIMKERPNDDID